MLTMLNEYVDFDQLIDLLVDTCKYSFKYK